jgi:hypothetical protein
LYLDGTAEYSGSGELPAMDQGALALRVNAGKTELVTLPENHPDTHVKRSNVEMRLGKNGAAELELQYETRGASAAAWRQRYSGEATRKARVIEDLSREFPGIELVDPATPIVTSDLSNYEQPVNIRVRARAPHVLREEGHTASLAVTPGERLTVQYASLPERKLDVDIGAFATLEETVTVQLPPGYSVLGAPTPQTTSSPFGSYSVTVNVEGGKVVVQSRLALSVSRVSPARYAEFRRFCQAADAAFEPRLVLGASEP